MLETKQMVQQHELSLAEREYEDMSAELRLILSGVAPGARTTASTATEATESADVRVDREADADQRLAALKRRMGK